ncbi:MAG: hypothetical protein ACLVG5_07715 [Clostridium sp.]
MQENRKTMISRIAEFHKVSFEQFKGDWEDTFEAGGYTQYL